MNHFQQKVSEYYQNAKRSKKIVAEFFLVHSDEIAFMTLEEISAKIGISASTITRTATEIGYDGYSGLQDKVRNSIKRTLAPADRLVRRDLPKDSLGFRESLALDQHNLVTLVSINEENKIEQTVEALATASHVYLMGFRSSRSPASFLALTLSQIRPQVRLIDDKEGYLPELTLDLQPNDVLFTIALPRYSRLVVETMKDAKKRGCRILSVSDGPLSPLSQLSSISLFVPYESYSFFNSTVATLALFNALATAVNVRLGHQALERLKCHSQLMSDKKVLLEDGTQRSS